MGHYRRVRDEIRVFVGTLQKPLTVETGWSSIWGESLTGAVADWRVGNFFQRANERSKRLSRADPEYPTITIEMYLARPTVMSANIYSGWPLRNKTATANIGIAPIIRFCMRHEQSTFTSLET